MSIVTSQEDIRKEVPGWGSQDVKDVNKATSIIGEKEMIRDAKKNLLLRPPFPHANPSEKSHKSER